MYSVPQVCFFPEWKFTEWSVCSKICGGGEKIRSAVCQDGYGRTFQPRVCQDGGGDQTVACNEEKCPGNGQGHQLDNEIYTFCYNLIINITDYTKIILIAGFAGKHLDDIEIIDLTVTQPNNCTTLPKYPVKINGNSAALFEGKLISCAGAADANNQCYIFDPVAKIWSDSGATATTPHHRGKGMTEVGGILLISVGKRTETWDGSQLSAGPDIPTTMRGYHCQATVNRTHVFFANSATGGTGGGDTYLLNWETKEWTQLADLERKRSNPACGVAHSQDKGTEIIVTSLGASDIFSINTMQWRVGPTIQETSSLSGHAVAQFSSTFMIIGGHENGKQILKYNAATETFDVQPQVLKLPRGYTTAVPVPDSMVEC